MIFNNGFAEFLEEQNRLFTQGYYLESKNQILEYRNKDLDPYQQIKLQSYLGIAEYFLGNYDISEKYLVTSIEQLDKKLDTYFYLRATIYKCSLFMRISKIEEGIEILHSILNEIQEFNFLDLLGLAYNWIGNGNWLIGKLNEALIYHKKSLEIQEQRSDRQNIAKSMNNMGIIYRAQGKLKKTIELYDKATSGQVVNVGTLGYLYSNRGIAYYELGRFNDALLDQFKAYTYRMKSGASVLIADSLFNTIRIAKNLNNTNLINATIAKFKNLPENVKSLSSLKEMSQAFLIVDNSPEKAKKLFEKALSNKSLEFGYKIICQEEILKILVDKWIRNQTKLDEVNKYIDSFESFAIEQNLFQAIIKIYIVRSLIYKNVMEFDKAIDCLEYAINLALKYDLPYHKQLAEEELENSKQEFLRFSKMYSSTSEESKKEKIIEKQKANELNDVLYYLNDLHKILSNKFEKF